MLIWCFLHSTLNLVTFTSTPKEQPFYVGVTGFAYGSGCILGPIVGGSLADSSATWRWVSQLLRPSIISFDLIDTIN